ncbi:UNVERIFIED_CONTAM: CHAD domain-containing protein, partial [Methylobacteriaceae bacterium AG10]|nr:CHAD domain-containing protein [Methylobacteriaceae bacterium AG10]
SGGGSRRFGRELGQTRDWDVLCMQSIPAAGASFPGELARISEAAASARQASHRKLEGILHRGAFTTLILHLAVELSCLDDPDRNNLEMEQPFTQIGPYLMDRIAGKITKRTSHVMRLSANGLHSLRKKLDRLYDDIAFVEALYPKPHLSAYRARCEELQEILGLANDAVVTRRLVRGLVKSDSGNLERPGRHILSWSKERRKEALRGLERATVNFRLASPFWR